MSGSPAVGFHNGNGVRVSGSGAENDFTAALAAHIDRFSSSSSSVVDRGIGNIHSGQFADHRLVLKNRLEHALADLCLIRSVGGEEFLFAGHTLYNRRDIVVVCAGTAEDGAEHNVFSGNFFHCAADFQLGHTRWKVQLPFEL